MGGMSSYQVGLIERQGCLSGHSVGDAGSDNSD